jgi:hypothetical protein
VDTHDELGIVLDEAGGKTDSSERHDLDGNPAFGSKCLYRCKSSPPSIIVPIAARDIVLTADEIRRDLP